MKTKSVLGAALLCALAFVTTTEAQPGETGIVKLGDAKIEYFSQGRGEAVVLLPGGSFDVGYLEPLAAKLAEAGYRAVRVNPRGAGKSTGPGKGVTYHTYAADVAGVIQSLQLKPANVVGHAFGSGTAHPATGTQLTCPIHLSAGNPLERFRLGARGRLVEAAEPRLKILCRPLEGDSLRQSGFSVGHSGQPRRLPPGVPPISVQPAGNDPLIPVRCLL